MTTRPIWGKLSKMLSAERNKAYDEERKMALEKEARALKQLGSDRRSYEDFCIRLVSAGAMKGRVPSFNEWRGSTTRY